MILLALGNILYLYFSGLGEFMVYTKASLVSMVITILGGVILIQEFEIEGAIATLTMSYAVLFVYQYYFYKFNKRRILKTESTQ